MSLLKLKTSFLWLEIRHYFFSLPASFQKGNADYAHLSLRNYKAIFFPPPNGATDIPISSFWGREHLPEWSRLWSGWGQSCRRIRAPCFPGLEQVHSILRVEPKFFTWVQPGPGRPLWSLRSTLPLFHSHLYGCLFKSHLQPLSHAVYWDWDPEIDL